jgi:hypothetical protein
MIYLINHYFIHLSNKDRREKSEDRTEKSEESYWYSFATLHYAPPSVNQGPTFSTRCSGSTKLVNLINDVVYIPIVYLYADEMVADLTEMDIEVDGPTNAGTTSATLDEVTDSRNG